MPSVIHLRSSDERIFTVDIKIAANFEAIRETLGELKPKQDTIRLQYIHSSVLKYLLQWIRFHHNNPEFTPKVLMWEREFLKENESKLLQIILAANLLKIPKLTSLGCRVLDEMIKDKSTDEIRKMFKIKKSDADSLDCV